MSWKKVMRITILNSIIIVMLILTFSPGFLAASPRDPNIFIAAWSIALPVISAILVVYGNYKIITKKEQEIEFEYDINEVTKEEEYVEAIRETKKRLPFLVDIMDLAIEQIENISRKQLRLKEYLAQRGLDMEILLQESEYAKKYVLDNIKNILSECILIDEVTARKNSQVYDEQRVYFTKLLEYNEKMLEEFEVFLREVARKGTKPLTENQSLQSMVVVLRQLRGAEDPFNFSQ